MYLWLDLGTSGVLLAANDGYAPDPETAVHFGYFIFTLYDIEKAGKVFHHSMLLKGGLEPCSLKKGHSPEIYDILIYNHAQN